MQLPSRRNPWGGRATTASGALRAAGASACSGALGGPRGWSKGYPNVLGTAGGGQSRYLLRAPRKPGLALAALWQGAEHHPALAVQASSTQGSSPPAPNRHHLVLPTALQPCPGWHCPAGGQGWGQRGSSPPALRPAPLPAAWRGWRGRGMAAICRARLNNRPPRKISRPPPRPSIVFGTCCCFFRLLSYFSLTFFPDLRHMPSPCPAALN